MYSDYVRVIDSHLSFFVTLISTAISRIATLKSVLTLMLAVVTLQTVKTTWDISIICIIVNSHSSYLVIPYHTFMRAVQVHYLVWLFVRCLYYGLSFNVYFVVVC